MTRIYFVRHAEPDKTVEDDRTRPLTEKGLADTQFVYETLKDKGIDIAICSPYKRSIDTIKRLTDALGLDIQTDERFRERKEGLKGTGLTIHPERWEATEWESDWGECVQDVKKRNVEALMDVLDKYEGHNIVLGTHGTAFSTILDYLSPEYGYDDFTRKMYWMPNIVEIVFDKRDVVEINELCHIENKK